MSNQIKKANKKDLVKIQDVVYFKLSMMFFIACAAIIFIMRLSYTGSNGNTGLWFWRLANNSIFLIVLSILFVAAVIFMIYKKLIKKQDERLKYIASINLVALTGYALFSTLFFGHYDNPNIALLVATVMLIVLYYVYYIFRADFFMFTSISILMCLCIWMFATETSAIYIAVKIALIIAICALIFYIKSNIKKISNLIYNEQGKSSKVENGKLVVWPMFVSLIVFAVLMFAENFFRISNTINIVIMLVQFIIAGVYYTINLIREA